MDPVTASLIIAGMTGIFGLFSKAKAAVYTPLQSVTPPGYVPNAIVKIDPSYNSSDQGAQQEYDAAAYAAALNKNHNNPMGGTLGTVEDMIFGAVAATPQGQAAINQAASNYATNSVKNNWGWIVALIALGGASIYLLFQNLNSPRRGR